MVFDIFVQHHQYDMILMDYSSYNLIYDRGVSLNNGGRGVLKFVVVGRMPVYISLFFASLIDVNTPEIILILLKPDTIKPPLRIC